MTNVYATIYSNIINYYIIILIIVFVALLQFFTLIDKIYCHQFSVRKTTLVLITHKEIEMFEKFVVVPDFLGDFDEMVTGQSVVTQ